MKVRASVETSLGLFINDTVPERSAERLVGVSVAAVDWSAVSVPTVVANRHVSVTVSQ
jgi:hypothetical protein